MHHGRLPRADVFNFEYQSKSWAATTIVLDRRQSFVPDRPLDRPRPERKVKRRTAVALPAAASSIKIDNDLTRFDTADNEVKHIPGNPPVELREKAVPRKGTVFGYNTALSVVFATKAGTLSTGPIGPNKR